MQRLLITGMTSWHGWPLSNAFTMHLGSSQVHGLCPHCKHVRPTCPQAMSALFYARQRWSARGFRTFSSCDVMHAAGMYDVHVSALRPELAYQRNIEGARNVAPLSCDCHGLFYDTHLILLGNTPPEAGSDAASPPDSLRMMGKTCNQAEQVLGPVARTGNRTLHAQRAYVVIGCPPRA
jgi:nucleoside-diphosphate-sugar epimerase